MPSLITRGSTFRGMRILERLEQLAVIGDRIGYSPEEDAAHELAAGWFREAGLELEVDAARNLIGRIPGGGRQVWTGSHLDTVPGAGRFDGTLGVVAGLEAVEALGLPGLGVVVFRDEERGCAGSRGCAAKSDAYVELHIEQGPTLLRADVPLGVVTGIVGYVRGRRTFTGTAGHAGTTPMDVREDALVHAAEFVLHARDVARGIDGSVATVGQVSVEPGGTNVIPGRVVVSIEPVRPTQSDSTASLPRSRSRSPCGRSLRRWPMRFALRFAPRSRPSDCRWSSCRPAPATSGHPRVGRHPLRHALRPQPQWGNQPQPGGAQLAGGHRTRRQRPDRGIEEAGDVKAVVVNRARVTGSGTSSSSPAARTRLASTSRSSRIQPHSGGPPLHSHAAEDDSFTCSKAS